MIYECLGNRFYEFLHRVSPQLDGPSGEFRSSLYKGYEHTHSGRTPGERLGLRSCCFGLLRKLRTVSLG